jgi:acetyl esterase/lipase
MPCFVVRDVWRMVGVLTLLGLLSACRATSFFVANAPNAVGGVERHTDISFGEDPRQRLDVYVPRTTAPRPVVIFWYGGSWTAGSKREYAFVGEALAHRGIVAVLPDYRLYPQVTFPAFEEDAARAVAWVERHAPEYGGDARHIVLMGHSAGAHTAAFLALNHEFLRRFAAEPGCIAGLVGLSGPYVLAPDTDVLRATFPAPYTERDWQPVQFADAAAPPTLLLHGEKDNDVRVEEAVALRDVLQGYGDRVELHIYPDRGHGSTVAPFALVMRWRTPAVQDTVDFVNRVAHASSDQPGDRSCVSRDGNDR